MRRYIYLVFIGAFITGNVAPSEIHKYSSNLAWLFGLRDRSNENKEETRTVCRTKECEQLANAVLNNMNKSVNPCDDFYEYACGRWPEHNPLPKGLPEWSYWYMMQVNIFRQIQDILKEKDKDDDLLSVKLAKKWYATCMDIDAIEKEGLEPLVSTLARFGGWPMIMDPDEWDEHENINWQKVDDEYVHLIGRSSFYNVKVHVPLHENETRLIYIENPDLPVRSYELLELEELNDENEKENKTKEGKLGNNEGSGSGDGDDDDYDYDDYDDDDDDDGDGSIYIKKRNNEQRFKKKQLNHGKNRKFTHGVKRRNGKRISYTTSKLYNKRISSEKHNEHKARKHRVKKRAATKIGRKHARHSAHRHNKKKSRKNKRTKIIAKNAEVQKLATIIPPEFITEDSEKHNMTVFEEHTNYISKVAHAIAKERGVKIAKEQIDKDIKDMILFEEKLVKKIFELSGDKLNFTLNGFQKWYDSKGHKTAKSKINWVYKITQLFEDANLAVNGDSHIKVLSSDFFKDLVSLLDETSSRTIVNYVHWSFLREIIQTTTREMRKLYREWNKKYVKLEEMFEDFEEDEEENEKDEKEDEVVKREVDRNEMGLRLLECLKPKQIKDILAYEYVKKHFTDNITDNAIEMIEDIQKEIENQVKKSDWMDEDTKDFILLKLMHMKKLVGYPDWFKNNTRMKQYFRGLFIGKSHYENTLSFLRYVRWKKLNAMKRGDGELQWVNPTILNAFYDVQKNSLSLTAADFQSPLFSYNRPQMVNYGLIGFFMSHELNHGFDDTSHEFDKNGNYMKWLSAMAEAYSKRAECFVEQYNNYPIDKTVDIKIEDYGNHTLDENIADTMGLQAVYRTYQRRQKESCKPNEALPGLEKFTNDQLFFLTFANMWCETIEPKSAEQSAKSDVHSPGRLRVIGSVSNSKDFAEVFDCPVGSKMNPEKKCNIWK